MSQGPTLQGSLLLSTLIISFIFWIAMIGASVSEHPSFFAGSLNIIVIRIDWVNSKSVRFSTERRPDIFLDSQTYFCRKLWEILKSTHNFNLSKDKNLCSEKKMFAIEIFQKIYKSFIFIYIYLYFYVVSISN